MTGRGDAVARSTPEVDLIAGKSFAFGQTSASQLPLGVDLAGMQVILAGRSLPLAYSSGGLINAVVPYDVDPDGLYSLVVSRAAALSGPETLAVAGAQPGIFKVDASGNPQVAQIFWTGFLSGAVLDSASAAPGAPVGEAKATVASATLVTGYTGMYQVRIAVPEGAAPGDGIPIVVVSAGTFFGR